MLKIDTVTFVRTLNDVVKTDGAEALDALLTTAPEDCTDAHFRLSAELARSLNPSQLVALRALVVMVKQDAVAATLKELGDNVSLLTTPTAPTPADGKIRLTHLADTYLEAIEKKTT